MSEETKVDYKSCVGKTYIKDGKEATVTDFAEKVLLNSKWAPAFLLTTDHKLIKRYVSADDFLSTATLKE